ncbi:MAG TPA: LUD domain-containing protein [Solirubrobacteraceae bacterium]|nr:LUD domain-containing protein [Solirubrobacteraceae bacterium]
MSARDEILGRIHTALADVPADEPPAALLDPVVAAPGDVDRFAERAADYRATVVRADDVAAAVAAACERHDARRLLAPDGLPDWAPEGVELVTDTPAAPLDRDTVAGADGVLTTCALAIAETGTIILDAGPGQGRRALTLLPDLHICVVPADRIVAGVPDAIAELAATRAPITFISGPSATSDIELNRVEGVHGPRRLEIVIAG